MLTGWRGFAVTAVAVVLAMAAILSAALAGDDAETGGEYDGMGGGVPGYESAFIGELSAAQDEDGSWNGSLDTTALSAYAVTLHETDVDSLNWTMDNYVAGDDTTAGAMLVLAEVPPDASQDSIREYDEVFRASVAADLAEAQDADGGWGDVSSTALATYALARAYGSDNASAQRGMAWLEEMEPRTVEEEAKVALAGLATGGDPDKSVEAIAGAQAANGSFGTFRDTAWAVMALSESGDTAGARDGLAWLRGREPENGDELALGALAEQYYLSAAETDSAVARESQVVIATWQYAVGAFVLSSLGLMGLLFSRLSGDEVMEGLRRQIYDHIERNPGEHVAEITRKLAISSSSARYHLTVLEYNEKVVAHKSGKLKHYYSSHNGYGIYTNGFEYKDVLASLKNETARKMVKFIIERGGVNQKDIAEHLQMHPSTVGWHARRLKSAHVIVRTRSGKEIVYSVNGEIEVAKVVSVLDRASS